MSTDHSPEFSHDDVIFFAKGNKDNGGSSHGVGILIWLTALKDRLLVNRLRGIVEDSEACRRITLAADFSHSAETKAKISKRMESGDGSMSKDWRGQKHAREELFYQLQIANRLPSLPDPIREKLLEVYNAKEEGWQGTLKDVYDEATHYDDASSYF